MFVNGTLEQFGEYSDGLWLPADFLEEYRFMVAQVIVRISAEGNEQRVSLDGAVDFELIDVAVCQLDFAVAAVDCQRFVCLSSNPVSVLVQVLPLVVANGYVDGEVSVIVRAEIFVNIVRIIAFCPCQFQFDFVCNGP